eukprot:PITA_26539
MMIGKEGQLLVVIPCEFIHHTREPSGDGHSGDRQSTAENLTETDLEAAQQLLQLSSQSLESVGSEDDEDASSSTHCHRHEPKKWLQFDSAGGNGWIASRKSASRVATGRSEGLVNRRQLTAGDTRDGLDEGAPRRYKPISRIYDITCPTRGGGAQWAVKRRK